MQLPCPGGLVGRLLCDILWTGDSYMAAAPIYHISLDERGVAYIAGTSMKIADIAIDSKTWGMTPQEIQENDPRLSLAQTYAAQAAMRASESGGGNGFIK